MMKEFIKDFLNIIFDALEDLVVMIDRLLRKNKFFRLANS